MQNNEKKHKKNKEAQLVIPAGQPLQDGVEVIRCDNFTYAHPDTPNVNVFHNVSFALVAGNCVGIVGPNGVGKT